MAVLVTAKAIPAKLVVPLYSVQAAGVAADEWLQSLEERAEPGVHTRKAEGARVEGAKAVTRLMALTMPSVVEMVPEVPLEATGQ